MSNQILSFPKATHLAQTKTSTAAPQITGLQANPAAAPGLSLRPRHKSYGARKW